MLNTQILIFIKIIVIIVLAGSLIYFFTRPEVKEEFDVGFLNHFLNQKPSGVKEISMPEKISRDKKIAMVIAFRDFRDVEYFVPKEILETAGAEVKTASNKLGTAIGADGGDVEIDLLISEVKPADFDAVVFIGGPGALANLDNENSYKLVRETISQNKVLAGICISPAILAKAGVLKGKKATVWSSTMDRGPIRVLEENGAIYQDKSVIIDEKIITANGPSAAEEFAKAIIVAIK